jgi:hypothetical protein
MGWVFQGNPKKFDIDDYLGRYPELIYWLTPRNASDIALGDRVFIWRAGEASGAIAVGTVVELPKRPDDVDHPDALGGDLWTTEPPDNSALRTGIHLEEVRLSSAEGMLDRALVKEHPLLADTSLIRMPNGTVFRLSQVQTQILELLWGRIPGAAAGTASANEGDRRLRSHYVRERSSRLRKDKLAQFRLAHSKLFCELCGEQEAGRYPSISESSIFEVHHRTPLTLSATPIRTTLADLAVLCANCHRAVHASDAVDDNFRRLEEHFGKVS